MKERVCQFSEHCQHEFADISLPGEGCLLGSLVGWGIAPCPGPSWHCRSHRLLACSTQTKPLAMQAIVTRGVSGGERSDNEATLTPSLSYFFVNGFLLF